MKKRKKKKENNHLYKIIKNNFGSLLDKFV